MSSVAPGEAVLAAAAVVFCGAATLATLALVVCAKQSMRFPFDDVSAANVAARLTNHYDRAGVLGGCLSAGMGWREAAVLLAGTGKLPHMHFGARVLCALCSLAALASALASAAPCSTCVARPLLVAHGVAGFAWSVASAAKSAAVLKLVRGSLLRRLQRWEALFAATVDVAALLLVDFALLVLGTMAAFAGLAAEQTDGAQLAAATLTVAAAVVQVLGPCLAMHTLWIGRDLDALTPGVDQTGKKKQSLKFGSSQRRMLAHALELQGHTDDREDPDPDLDLDQDEEMPALLDLGLAVTPLEAPLELTLVSPGDGSRKRVVPAEPGEQPETSIVRPFPAHDVDEDQQGAAPSLSEDEDEDGHQHQHQHQHQHHQQRKRFMNGSAKQAASAERVGAATRRTSVALGLLRVEGRWAGAECLVRALCAGLAAALLALTVRQGGDGLSTFLALDATALLLLQTGRLCADLFRVARPLSKDVRVVLSWKNTCLGRLCLAVEGTLVVLSVVGVSSASRFAVLESDAMVGLTACAAVTTGVTFVLSYMALVGYAGGEIHVPNKRISAMIRSTMLHHDSSTSGGPGFVFPVVLQRPEEARSAKAFVAEVPKFMPVEPVAPLQHDDAVGTTVLQAAATTEEDDDKDPLSASSKMAQLVRKHSSNTLRLLKRAAFGAEVPTAGRADSGKSEEVLLEISEPRLNLSASGQGLAGVVRHEGDTSGTVVAII